MENPLVSIIIPVYNGSKYMRQAIDSALRQSYKNIEIIVVNDGSDDNGETDKTALSYGDKIRYFKKENGGVSSALNLGIREMKGDYFSWLSHDDFYLKNKIESEIEALKKIDEKKTVVYCDSILIDKDGKPLPKLRKKKELKKNKSNDWETVLRQLLKHGTLNGCGFLLPKEIFDICGYFDERLRYNQDILMWYKIFTEKFSLYYDATVGTALRIHNEQLTQTGKELFHKDSETASEYLIPRFADISSKNKNFLFLYAINSAKYANFSVAKRCIEEGKKKGLFDMSNKIMISIFIVYGKIRPLIRKTYYKLFRKVKTQ